MSVTKLSDLLPISDDNSAPNAYQVLGLSVGESDRDTIKLAVDGVIAKVKAAKSKTDPSLWKHAAGIVQVARVTLADADKKARLDAELGIVKSSTATSSTATASDRTADSKPVDPLAALLPPVNPLRPVTPLPPADSSPSSDRNHPIPTGLFQGPVMDDDGEPIARDAAPPFPIVPMAEHIEPVSPTIPQPTVQQPTIRKDDRPIRRRRKSMFVPIILSLIILSLVAIVGLLAYFLFFRQGTIAISSDGGKVSIDTGRPAERGLQRGKQLKNQKMVNSPAESVARPSPIPSSKSPRFPTRSDYQPKSEPTMAVEDSAESDPNADEDSQSTPVSSTPVSSTPVSTEPMMSAAPPPMDTAVQETMVQVSPLVVAEKLTELRSAIRRADWQGMIALAEAVDGMKVGKKQSPEAETLLSIADLATYYRGAIERAVADLRAGDDFEVKNGFRVIVVSKTDHSLTIQYNTKQPEFTFDKLPLSLAHRLATFQMPPSATSKAAKAVYQSIVPNSTPQQRAEAIEALGALGDPIEGADRDGVIQTLQSILDDK
jgi:hypothetical protein